MRIGKRETEVRNKKCVRDVTEVVRDKEINRERLRERDIQVGNEKVLCVVRDRP